MLTQTNSPKATVAKFNKNAGQFHNSLTQQISILISTPLISTGQIEAIIKFLLYIMPIKAKMVAVVPKSMSNAPKELIRFATKHPTTNGKKYFLLKKHSKTNAYAMRN